MRSTLLLLAALAALAAPAATTGYKSMWITESVSGRTVGPVVNKPGNTFEAGGRTWVVMSAPAGQIDFADKATMKREGPYGLVEQRLFDLGPLAYVFTRIEDFVGDDPSADESVVVQARRAAPSPSATAWGENLPVRWVLDPVPSTNPAAHKDPIRTWTLERREVAPTVTGWIEPWHEDKYDWSLGGLAASKGDGIPSVRLGASGAWEGFFADAALVFAGKSGTLAGDSTALSRLRVDGGDGFFLRGGYEYGMVVDGPWSATVSLFGTWQRLSAEASATTTYEKPAPKPDAASGSDPVAAAVAAVADAAFASSVYGFREWSADATLTDVRLTAGAGLAYDEWYWGASFRVLFDAWDDTSIDVDVPVLGRVHPLDAERSRPLSLQFGGWYSPDDFWVIEGSLVVSGETALRIGAGIFF